jgi:hypothetical protein
MVLAQSQSPEMAQPQALQGEEPLAPLTRLVSVMTLYLLSVLLLILTALLVTQRRSKKWHLVL